jgi:flagellar basal body-associated protein FliL
MSKKVLILGIAVVAVVLAVGGVATYVWVDYSQAQNALTRSQQDVRDVEENIRRHPEDVARLREMYKLAKFQVDALEEYHHTWINKDEISGLQSALERDKRAIDQLPGAADK